METHGSRKFWDNFVVDDDRKGVDRRGWMWMWIGTHCLCFGAESDKVLQVSIPNMIGPASACILLCCTLQSP